MRTWQRRSSTYILVVALVLMAGMSALLGCGGQPAATGTASPSAITTFRSARYRFAISYDPRVFHAASEFVPDAVGLSPQLNWNAWPASMGSTKPDLKVLPHSVGVTAIDFKARGLTDANLAGEMAAQRRFALAQREGVYRIVNLGGAKGYRAQWIAAGEDGRAYRVTAYGLVSGRFDYHITTVCRLSDWPAMRRPLLAVVDSFRAL